MKRDIYGQLLKWKQRNGRKPLIVRGARQTGKTYILRQFAEAEFGHCLYVNFEEDKQAAALFEPDLDPRRLIQHLGLLYGCEIKIGSSLLILDEIQASSAALNSLKYFNEKLPDLHVAAAGSHLGVKLGKARGFPVGQVQFLDLYPLSFFEYLTALGRDSLRRHLEAVTRDSSLSEAVHLRCLTYLKAYLITGGMPEVVDAYVNGASLHEVRILQKALLDGYQSDFAKYASASDAIKILHIWESIPAQLAKDNTKFIFKVVKSGARAREYESALQWLADAGLIYKVGNITTAELPLAVQKDRTCFKVYFFDIGLLGALARLDPQLVLDEDRLFSTFKGAFTENYVVQELIASGKHSFAYWTNPSGTAEVDIVLEDGGELHPLEIKSGFDKTKRSLRVFSEKTGITSLYRASKRNLKQDGDFQNYPLYLVTRFPIVK